MDLLISISLAKYFPGDFNYKIVYMFLFSAWLVIRIYYFYFVLQNVEMLNGQTPDGNTYYEQYNAPCNVIRTGDCVYVRTDMGRQLIAQVDSVWTNKQ